MAKATNNENLRPSLLDRLQVESAAPAKTSAEHDPGENYQPSRDELLSRRVASQNQRFSARKIKDVVLRDLAWLLNTTSLEAVMDLDDYPNVQSSVVNYGVPGLTGISVGNLDASMVERRFREIILRFEPRIIPSSLQVRVDAGDAYTNRALSFVIDCKVWSYPAPEELHVSSQIDMESGKIKIGEQGRGF